MEQNNNTATFTVGQIVKYGYWGDNHYETEILFEVVARTTKFVTLLNRHGDTYRIKVREGDWAKGEYCFHTPYASSAIYASSAMGVK